MRHVEKILREGEKRQRRQREKLNLGEKGLWLIFRIGKLRRKEEHEKRAKIRRGTCHLGIWQQKQSRGGRNGVRLQRDKATLKLTFT